MAEKQEKSPFKEYTVLCNSTILDELFCVSDVYRIFVLSLTAEKITGETDTTIQQFADLVGESKNNYTGKDALTDKLRKCNDIKLETRFVEKGPGKKPKKRNFYTFKIPKPADITENLDTFRMIYREFLLIDDLSIKIKGYLIKLYSVANTNTLYMDRNITELEKLLHMSHNTITTYNKELEAKGYIKIEKDGLFIKCQGFKPILKRSDRTKEILSGFKQNLESAISAYNYNYQVHFDIKSLTLSDLKKLKLDKMTDIYAKYHITDFKTAENINSIAFFLETGLSSRTKQEEPVFELEEILIV